MKKLSTDEVARRIREMATSCPDALAKALAVAMPSYEIVTRDRITMFLAQCAHESRGFTVMEENLNYSTEGLMRTWPSRFPTFTHAAGYARRPEAIANHVYADRLGNGNEASGDGWNYRGRGIIQITGRGNYEKIGAAIGNNLVRFPEDAAAPAVAVKAACHYWQSHGLNALADRGDFEEVTRRINGGLIGIDNRLKWLARARDAFQLGEDGSYV